MNQPTPVNYLKVEYRDLSKFFSEERFDKFREEIYNHHCQMAVKDGSFVVDNYFLCETLVMQMMKEYLKSYGFIIDPKFGMYEDGKLLRDYDGVLINWRW